MAILNWTDYPRFWIAKLPPANLHYDMVILANDDDKLYRSDGSAWVPYSPQITWGLVPPTAYLNEGVTLVSEASSLNVVGLNANLTAAGSALTLTLSGPEIRSAGTPLVATPTSINFQGTGVSATNSGNAITVTVNGSPISVSDEGSLLSSNINSLNFTGGGVSASAAGAAITVNVPSPPGITVQDEGSTLTSALSQLNFVGSAVVASNTGGAVTVTINDTTVLGSAPPAIAATSSAGAASSVSRSDHTHAGVTSVNGSQGAVTVTVPVAATVAPPSIAASAAVGTASDFARRDHTHDGVTSVNGNKGVVTVTVPVAASVSPANLGTTATGTSPDFARADHVHAHGNLAGGTLHSLATTGADGFMSAADKAKADAYTPSALTVATTAPASPATGDVWIDSSGPGTAGVWKYAKLASAVSSTSTTPANVGLSMTPEANKTYVLEALLIMQTTSTTIGSRPGLAWSTGLSDGVVSLSQPFDATSVDLDFGNISANLVGRNGGFTSANTSYVADLRATFTAGASPSGNVEITLSSESTTSVSMRAGSWIRWQEVA